MQRLALFDLDNTLIDRTGGFRRWAREFAADRGLEADAVEWMMAADRDGYAPREAFFGELREHFSLPEPAAALWDQYRERFPVLIAYRRDVLAGLAELRADGWRIAIVTNGMRDSQTAKIRRGGLADHVDAWCVSEIEGVRKPDTEIFARAAARCGLSVDGGGWMVGDNPVDDIQGAAAAGLSTVWLHRGRQWSHGTPGPGHVVDDVLAAFAVLRAAAHGGSDAVA